jgi:16S rRNA (cytosine967-C5)-methyltransferase
VEDRGGPGARAAEKTVLLDVVTAREVAYEVVRRVLEQDSWADRTFRSVAGAAGLTGRDRAFAMQLAYGAVQRARTLDHAIDTLGRRPARKLDAPVLAALRLGAYQLGYMGSVPQHAAANESVELVRQAGLERAVAFTNAVLRRLAEGMTDLLAGLPESTPQEAALKHSYPDWVAETWWRELGEPDTLELMRAQNEPAERCVRINRRKLPDPEALGGERDPDLPDARCVESIHEDWVEAGLAWPQSRGSQLAGLAAGAQPGERVLDLCAAPGAKTTHLAALMGDEGEIVAVEADPRRAEDLRANAARLGVRSVQVVVGDASEASFGDGYDRVLVDPPCSDLGTLQSRPDARWRKTPDQVRELSALQRRILEAGAASLRPGGRLVYSTCTISADENARQVEAFLARRPDFTANVGRFVQTLPHRDRTDGFYIASLERHG